MQFIIQGKGITSKISGDAKYAKVKRALISNIRAFLDYGAYKTFRASEGIHTPKLTGNMESQAITSLKKGQPSRSYSN